MRSLGVLAALAAVLSLLPTSHGQEKKPEPKAPPRIVVALPLAVVPGKTAKVTVRGLRLDDAKEIRFADAAVKATLVSKGKAGVPDKNPDKVGDTQVVVEITVPADCQADSLPFTLVTPAGETKAHGLLVDREANRTAEKEPNDGFQQATPITIPGSVTGVIEKAADVDVFRLTGKKGERLRVEVQSARHGGALDAILTLYDAAGQQIASNSGGAGGGDALLTATLPRDGVYYLSLIDAHDSGGPTHVYRLLVRSAP